MNLKRAILLVIPCTVSCARSNPSSHSLDDDYSVPVLSSARNQRNPGLAQRIFDRIAPEFEGQPRYKASATVLLANTYALSGDLAKASHIRSRMNQSGLRKVPGLAWTVVDGKVVVSEIEVNGTMNMVSLKALSSSRSISSPLQ